MKLDESYGLPLHSNLLLREPSYLPKSNALGRPLLHNAQALPAL
jgi:hypothetical protein